MARQLGRWRCSTSLVGPRDGALLPSITDPVRTRTHDAAPPRRGDQAPEPGALLCLRVSLLVLWVRGMARLNASTTALNDIGKSSRRSGRPRRRARSAKHSTLASWEVRPFSDGCLPDEAAALNGRRKRTRTPPESEPHQSAGRRPGDRARTFWRRRHGSSSGAPPHLRPALREAHEYARQATRRT
jgi:hypothetical protein